MDRTQTRITTQRAEDLLRLADQAQVRGVRILLTADGEHFATSSSDPTTLHRVSRQGCDCRGFSYWQRCSHHSLLLSELGLIPDVDPDIAVEEHPAERCRCGGQGYTFPYTGGGLSDWVAVPCNCTRHAA